MTYLQLRVENGLLLSNRTFLRESAWRSDDCYKLLFSLNGKMSYTIDQSDFTFEPNQFAILNPLDTHKQLEVQQHKFLIELKPAFVNAIAQDLSPAQFDIQFATLPQNHFLVSQWVDFVQTMAQMPDSDKSMKFFLEHSLVQLGILLVQNAVNSRLDSFTMRTTKLHQSQIDRVLNALKEQWNMDWSLAEMAVIADMSTFQFAHKFKDVIGISPYTWLQLYRLVRSQELLKYSTKKIVDIAFECGFSSVAMYNTLFKRLYRMTPGAFRKMTTR